MHPLSLNNAPTKALVGASLKGYSLNCSTFRTATDPCCGSGGIFPHFCARSQKFVLVTENKNHPAFNVEADNLYIMYQDKLNLVEMLVKLKSNFGCKRITIQTGGTINSLFLREGLFDYIDIVVTPALIGGKSTSTLIDGESFTSVADLDKIGVLKLQSCEQLENSYLRLQYEIVRKNDKEET